MKKFFAILMITIMTIPAMSFAEETKNDNTQVISEQNISTAERIIDKYSEKMYETFSELAQNLKGPAKEAFGYMVKKEIAQGYVFMIPLVGFLLTLLLGIIIIYSSIRHDGNEALEAIGASALVASAIFLAISIFTTGSGIMYLIAPEYYAIQDIFELLK